MSDELRVNTDMKVNRISDEIWEIPTSEKPGMLVPARIYATRGILQAMDSGVFDQVTNVACLPGIRRYALCMPDGHWGYGFPIGGVAAFDAQDGIISPGGVGYDINCGMRLIRTDLTLADVQPHLEKLMTELFRKVPAGVGASGFVRLSGEEFGRVMTHGAKWCVERGYGWHRDLVRMEEGGCIQGADPSIVTDHAVKRGINQLGTLGSGNHYLEVQVVSNERIFDPVTAAALGITGHEQIVVMVHCGSRGFGHQVASDYLKVFEKSMRRYGITVKDQQLACAPFRSPEGQEYFSAMNCAANTDFANRQVITHQIREAFAAVFDPPRRWGWSWCMTWRITSPRSNGMQRGTWWCIAKARPGRLGQGVRNCQRCFDRPASRSFAAAPWRPAHTCWWGRIKRCATRSGRRCMGQEERCPARKRRERFAVGNCSNR